MVEDAEIIYEFDGVNVRDFLFEGAPSNIGFADVVGMEEGKNAVRREFFLTREQQALKAELGLENKHFLMLYGLPGTGKTFFALALMNELRSFWSDDIRVFSTSCEQLKSLFVGGTEKNIVALFEFVKQFERCVLFLDAFDAIAIDRTRAFDDPILMPAVNTLLFKLSSLSSSPNLVLVTATECPYHLDNAILSKVDLPIEVPLPSCGAFMDLLKRKIGKIIDFDVDLVAVSKRLEEAQFSIYDATKLIEKLKSDLFEKTLGDPSANRIDAKMVDDALQKIKSSINQHEIARLEKFRTEWF